MKNLWTILTLISPLVHPKQWSQMWRSLSNFPQANARRARVCQKNNRFLSVQHNQKRRAQNYLEWVDLKYRTRTKSKFPFQLPRTKRTRPVMFTMDPSRKANQIVWPLWTTMTSLNYYLENLILKEPSWWESWKSKAISCFCSDLTLCGWNYRN